MNSTVATEPSEKSAPGALLETWGKNERMRHIPAIEWLIDKVDRDLRQRIEKLYAPAAGASSSEPVEAELRALCRAIDRLADTAKYTRGGNHAPSELGPRIIRALDHAVACLRSIDGNLFSRRYPFQSFERSKSEMTYGALLVVIDHVHRLTALIRTIDPQVDERLLEGLVNLKEPLREQVMA